jgi:hypothetical protein
MKVLLGCEGKEHKVILKVLCNWLRRVDPSLTNLDLRLREFRGDEIWSDNKFIEFVGGARNREGWTKVILVFDDNQRDKVAQKARTLQSTDLPGVPICVLFIVPHMHGWVRRMLNPSDRAKLDQRPGGQKVKNMTGRLSAWEPTLPFKTRLLSFRNSGRPCNVSVIRAIDFRATSAAPHPPGGLGKDGDRPFPQHG